MAGPQPADRFETNDDGIIGGAKVWDTAMDQSFSGTSSDFVTVA